MGKKEDDYEAELEKLQIALVRWQQAAMLEGQKVLVIFEGRDAAGKDGTIKRIVEYLAVRATRVVALPKPTDRERTQWYFQRYIPHLPSGGELVLFNRSWYNRAGVERVMGFCTPAETETFLKVVPELESQIVGSGVHLIKFWMDVSREEQAERLQDRRTDPLAALKISSLDAVAQEKFDDYTAARDEMLKRTSSAHAPWICVDSNSKKRARLAVMRYLIKSLAPQAVADTVDPPDPEILFKFDSKALDRLAK